MKDVGRKMAKGAAWMVLFKLFERSIGLVTTLVLARLLVPEDFGIVAMAMSVVAVLDLLTGFSFDVALIQKQDAERGHYDTAWTLNIIAYATVALLMVLLAIPVATYYREPRVEYVLYILAIGVSVVGFENIGTVAFRKDLQLNKEFSFLLAKKLVAGVVGISIAVAFRTYWALVAGMVASRFVGVAVSYVVHPFRPRLSLQGAGDLLRFSKWLFVSGVFASLIARAPDFLIGRFAGATSLGIYNLGFELSNLPTTELAMPINRAVFPGYAKMAHDTALLRTGFLAVQSLISLLSIPAAVGVVVLAGPLVYVLLGVKWVGAIPVIEVLAFCGLLSALWASAWSLFVAFGRVNLPVQLNIVHLVTLIPGLIIGLNHGGIQGAAWASFASACAVFVATYVTLFRIVRIRWLDLLTIVWRPIIGAALMWLAVKHWLVWLDPTTVWSSQVTALLSGVLVGVAAYAVTVCSLWWMAGLPPGAEAKMFDIATRKLKHFWATRKVLGRGPT